MNLRWGYAPLAMALAASAGAAAHGASVNVDELAHCLAVTDNDARLACYDALAHRAANTNAAPSRVPVASNSAPPPSAPPSPLQPAAPPPPAVEDPKNFGLSAAQHHVERTQIKSQEAHIVSIAHGTAGQATIVLDNAQSWKVSGDVEWISQGDKVTIKRAALGSFLMHTPSHHTYSVSRID